MAIFLLLNGMAITFLLYVLAHFREEDKHKVRPLRIRSIRTTKPSVSVFTRPLPFEPRFPGRHSVIRFTEPEEAATRRTVGDAMLQG